MARRSDGCLTEPERKPALKEGQQTSPGATVADQDPGCVAPEGVIPELSVLARPIGFGLQSLGGATLRCSRLAWSLAGSANSLLKTAIAFAADGESDDRPQYSLHWLSPYESDMWD